MRGIYLFFIVSVLVILVGGMWNSVPAVKNTVHAVLNPTFGVLFNFNIYLGMFIVVLLINLITVLLQKYATDQVELKKLKEEQKLLQEEIKLVKNNPEKLMELNKKQLEFLPRTFDLTMKPLLYTFIPFVLFLRWFNDYFTAAGNPKFFGFLTWFWVYLIFSIVLSSIFRKIFKVY